MPVKNRFAELLPEITAWRRDLHEDQPAPGVGIFGQQLAHSPETLRLLLMYQKRLQSNLTHALRPISPTPAAHAEILAALIDGLYLRAALSRAATADAARGAVLSTLNTFLERPA